MRAIVLALKAKPQPGVHRPSVDVFAAIGNLTFEQLTFLRHRGAFSTVSLTFATCCQVVNHLDEASRRQPGGGTFLDLWYKVCCPHAPCPWLKAHVEVYREVSTAS